MCQKSLRSDGIYVTQCGAPLYFPDEIHSVSQQLRQVFAQVRFYLGFIPFYPSGLWSYVLGSQAMVQPSVEEIRDRVQAAQFTCRYYTPQIHHASAALPQFVEDLVA